MNRKRFLDESRVDRKSSELNSTIFSGLLFYINGHTKTPFIDLKEMIISNGGSVGKFLTLKTTHMIANQIPALKKVSSRTMVVKEIWVLNCISSQELVSEGPFLVCNKNPPKAEKYRESLIKTEDCDLPKRPLALNDIFNNYPYCFNSQHDFNSLNVFKAFDNHDFCKLQQLLDRTCLDDSEELKTAIIKTIEKKLDRKLNPKLSTFK
jgi:hypothetical protein